MFRFVYALLTPSLTLSLAVAASGQEVLERAIAYHDPSGAWSSARLEIVLSESRPNGPDRRTTVRFDNPQSLFEMERESDDGRTIRLRVHDDDVEAWIDGSRDVSAEDADRFRLGEEAARRTRNYYLYLYGLPMKLRDPGTHVGDGVEDTEFQGTKAREVRVSYSEEVGSDVWYFYFDPGTGALIGYRFYHDESKNDGEYIVLEGEARGAGLTLPRTRRWYRHQDGGYLGTDTIVSIAALDPGH